jgi:hypothetical protein
MRLSFRNSPLPATSWIFIAIVAVAAALMLLYLSEPLVRQEWPGKWWEILLWAVLVVAAEKFVINTPRGGAFVTVTAALDFAIIILYGPQLAIWFGLLEALVSSGLARKVPFYKLLFNSSQYVLTAGTAALVYVGLGGVILRNIPSSSIPYAQLILPFIACVPTYFLVNNALTCSIIGITEKISPLRVWYVDFKWTVSHDLILAPLGLVVALLFARYGWLAIFSIFAPLALARYVYKLYMELRDAYFDSIAALASALDASDPYTRGHSDRVTEYAKQVARAMGMSEREIESIEFAGRLHDIGKIGIDRSILRKRSRLNDREYREMQKHPNMGADIAGKLKFLKKAEGYVSHHHERYDGQGYPDGLKGEQIPLGARILGVVDAFDAMTSDRPYRPALPVEIAIKELQKGSGKQFDTEIVKIFIDLINSGDVSVEEHKVSNKE